MLQIFIKYNYFIGYSCGSVQMAAGNVTRVWEISENYKFERYQDIAANESHWQRWSYPERLSRLRRGEN